MTNLKTIAIWSAVGISIFGIGVWDFTYTRQHEQHRMQEVYDYGKQIGFVNGECYTLEGVNQSNPDSEWAHLPDVAKALTMCKSWDKAHGPGTTDTIKLK